MQRPFFAIANKAMEQMRQFLGEFGMTPASRARVHVEPQAAADPLDELRRQRS